MTKQLAKYYYVLDKRKELFIILYHIGAEKKWEEFEKCCDEKCFAKKLQTILTFKYSHVILSVEKCVFVYNIML